MKIFKIQLLQDVKNKGNSQLKNEYKKGTILNVAHASNLPEDSLIAFWVIQDHWQDDSIGFAIYKDIDYVLVTDYRLVSDIPSDYIFISDSQDVQLVKEYFPHVKNINDYDSFFVLVNNGDFDSVYGINGIVPVLDKQVYNILGV